MENENDHVQTCLEQFQKNTIISVDSADINLIKKLHPVDVTTNPSLLLKVAQMPEYQYLLDKAIAYGCSTIEALQESELVELILDKLFVSFGKEIITIIEGFISTEIDAKLSFDTEGSVKRARRIIKLYEEEGISRDRILIKIAATWEEKEGIKCNMTLIFNFSQAVACAEHGVTLVSPFVGRINDGYIAKYGKTYIPSEEPGVMLVKDIFNYFKKFDYKTFIMPASLRSAESALEMVGADRMTLPPGVFEKLSEMKTIVEMKLSIQQAKNKDIKKVSIDEKMFRWMINEDEIGNAKLADGIRTFARDTKKLEDLIKKQITI